jgi:WD40 repeat protein
MKNKTIFHEIDSFPASVSGGFYLPEKNKLVIGSFGNHILIWDLNMNRITDSIYTGENRIINCDFHYGTNQMVIGTRVGEIQVWGISSGRMVCKYNGQKSRIRDLNFSPDGDNIISGVSDKAVVYNIENKRIVKHLDIHDDIVASVFMGDRFIITGSWDKYIHVIDRKSFNIIHTELNTSCFTSICNQIVEISPGEKFLVFENLGEIQFLETRTWRSVYNYEADNQITEIAFAPNGQYLICGLSNGEISSLNLEEIASY